MEEQAPGQSASATRRQIVRLDTLHFLALRSGARRLADDATPDVVVLRVQHSDGPRSAEGRVEPKKVTGLREAGGGVEVADAGFGARRSAGSVEKRSFSQAARVPEVAGMPQR
jgi:hypothetical protein